VKQDVPTAGGVGITIKDMLFCLNVFEGLTVQELRTTYGKYTLFARVFFFSKIILIVLSSILQMSE
jgi:hypothetical protein